MGKDYESSTVAYKFYEKGKVPDDEDIADDLAAVLDIYEEYIKERGRILGPVNGPEEKSHPTADRAEVERLLQVFEDRGLHFPEELVANYLLALRTKRFVILSGLSGTGKTQLALAIAKFFQAREALPSVVEPPEGSVMLEVKPYMFEHDRISLPRALLAQMKLAPPREGTRGGGELFVSYPGGTEVRAFWHAGDASPSNLFLRGGFRDWFKSNLKPGDKLLLKPIPRENEDSDGLEIAQPKLAQRTVVLDNRCVVAVRPDWTDSRGLLGYFNPLTKSYVVEPALAFLLEAKKEEERAAQENRSPYPFFLILDEMNLAHVEQYFSDFLSCLESDESLSLHQELDIELGENEDGIAVPRKLQIPTNIYFTGTVNVDETTYMFSPKVLDRAFTIELQDVDLENYGKAGHAKNAHADSLKLARLPMLAISPKPSDKDWNAFQNLSAGKMREAIIAVNELLAPFGLHFGYRVANEIASFVSLASQHTDGSEQSLWSALDLAVLQKVLPKLHGTQEELDEPLRLIFGFALSTAVDFPIPTSEEISKEWSFDGDRLESSIGQADPRLPRSALKVWRMLQTLRRQGFASFIC